VTPALRATRALAAARLREMAREPGTLFWAFGFPLLLALGLGVAFREGSRNATALAIAVTPQAASTFARPIEAEGVTVRVADAAEAARLLRDGRVDVVVDGQGGHALAPIYRFDPARPSSKLARAQVDEILQRAAGRHDALAPRDEPIVAAGSRYIDFLIPGLLGMNAMMGSLWGVAYAVVSLRVRKLLKRLVASPVPRAAVLGGLVAARLVFFPAELLVLVTAGHFVFGVPIAGSPFALLAVGVTGCLAFAGMGVLIASRAPNVEIATGLMNAVILPLTLTSGVFFPITRFPAAVTPWLSLTPLAALTNALRAILLDGAGLASVLEPMLVLALWGAVPAALGLRRFRWS
jgi:ABC-type polysaccharide/polyol phosphate export permease